MGGHHSRQTTTQVTTILTESIFKQLQDCMVSGQGTNEIRVDGNGNIINDATQAITMKLNQDCASKAVQENSFSSNLANTVSQAMKEKGVAMTQFMDAGSTTVATHTRKHITQRNITEMVQTCMAKLTGANVINVKGNNNLLENITQTQALTVVGECLQGSATTNKSVNEITDAINQYSDRTLESPFAFITDAIASVSKSIIMVIGLCFSGLIGMVLLYKMFEKNNPDGSPRMRIPNF